MLSCGRPQCTFPKTNTKLQSANFTVLCKRKVTADCSAYDMLPSYLLWGASVMASIELHTTAATQQPFKGTITIPETSNFDLELGVSSYRPLD